MGGIGINLIGYLGGSIIASSMPLQVYQSWKRGTTNDISWKWLSGYITGISLLFIYAQLSNLPPVWGPLCLEISSTLMLILLKIKFDIIEHKVYTFNSSTQTDFDQENQQIVSSEKNQHHPYQNKEEKEELNSNSNQKKLKYEIIEVIAGDSDMV